MNVNDNLGLHSSKYSLQNDRSDKGHLDVSYDHFSRNATDSTTENLTFQPLSQTGEIKNVSKFGLSTPQFIPIFSGLSRCGVHLDDQEKGDIDTDLQPKRYSLNSSTSSNNDLDLLEWYSLYREADQPSSLKVSTSQNHKLSLKENHVTSKSGVMIPIPEEAHFPLESHFYSSFLDNEHSSHLIDNQRSSATFHHGFDESGLLESVTNNFTDHSNVFSPISGKIINSVNLSDYSQSNNVFDTLEVMRSPLTFSERPLEAETLIWEEKERENFDLTLLNSQVNKINSQSYLPVNSQSVNDLEQLTSLPWQLSDQIDSSLQIELANQREGGHSDLLSVLDGYGTLLESCSNEENLEDFEESTEEIHGGHLSQSVEIDCSELLQEIYKSYEDNELEKNSNFEFQNTLTIEKIRQRLPKLFNVTIKEDNFLRSREKKSFGRVQVMAKKRLKFQHSVRSPLSPLSSQRNGYSPLSLQHSFKRPFTRKMCNEILGSKMSVMSLSEQARALESYLFRGVNFSSHENENKTVEGIAELDNRQILARENQNNFDSKKRRLIKSDSEYNLKFSHKSSNRPLDYNPLYLSNFIAIFQSVKDLIECIINGFGKEEMPDESDGDTWSMVDAMMAELVNLAHSEETPNTIAGILHSLIEEVGKEKPSNSLAIQNFDLSTNILASKLSQVVKRVIRSGEKNFEIPFERLRGRAEEKLRRYANVFAFLDGIHKINNLFMDLWTIKRKEISSVFRKLILETVERHSSSNEDKSEDVSPCYIVPFPSESPVETVSQSDEEITRNLQNERRCVKRRLQYTDSSPKSRSDGVRGSTGSSDCDDQDDRRWRPSSSGSIGYSMSRKEKGLSGARGELPQAAALRMKTWLISHWDHPYPSKKDKVNLAKACKINVKQVEDWMVNARARIWKPLTLEMVKEVQKNQRR